MIAASVPCHSAKQVQVQVMGLLNDNVQGDENWICGNCRA